MRNKSTVTIMSREQILENGEREKGYEWKEYKKYVYWSEPDVVGWLNNGELLTTKPFNSRKTGQPFRLSFYTSIKFLEIKTLLSLSDTS